MVSPTRSSITHVHQKLFLSLPIDNTSPHSRSSFEYRTSKSRLLFHRLHSDTNSRTLRAQHFSKARWQIKFYEFFTHSRKVQNNIALFIAPQWTYSIGSQGNASYSAHKCMPRGNCDGIVDSDHRG